MARQYFIYLLASYRRVIYVGVTNDLERRLRQHQTKAHPESFTARYNVNRLVYYEVFADVREAIAREKKIKGWRRSKKVELIQSTNPDWRDLSLDWQVD